jgi:hypothetical protein
MKLLLEIRIGWIYGNLLKISVLKHNRVRISNEIPNCCMKSRQNSIDNDVVIFIVS